MGFTWDRHAEFMPRPIIIAAMELCTPEVVDFLLNFGADLSSEHEGTEIRAVSFLISVPITFTIIVLSVLLYSFYFPRVHVV